MNARTLSTLTKAIRAHGSPVALETLGWTSRDFFAAWSDELNALDEWGECEISSRHTWHGRPVIVTLEG
jgi:hypothetical protein